ncbi:GAF domain-containing protein [Streptomyces atriruber]|uniref:GAF domain-containing protein n=1 Tax=Streptomyces atriruber TaxID=545121 RepID=A0ABV3BHJ1_9ACTN
MTERDADVAWRRAAAARARAAQAAAAADHHDLLWQQNGSDRHRVLAEFHRDTVAHHLAAAEMQEAYARRLSAWSPRQREARPPFMRSVATVCGADGGALVVLDKNRQQVAVTSSDACACRAQDLEYVLGEGPMRDVARSGRAAAAAHLDLVTRWPFYGRGILDLGLRAASAVPLMSGAYRFGVLAVFSEVRLPLEADLRRIAAALAEQVLFGPDGDPLLYGDIAEQSPVHRATDRVRLQEECTATDALDLIKARAFREGTTTVDIARRIVEADLRLTSEPE